MTNLRHSILKKLYKLADTLESDKDLPFNTFDAMQKIIRKDPDNFIHQAMYVADKDHASLLGGEWLQLRKGALGLRGQRRKIFYGHGNSSYRIESIHRLMIKAVGEDFEIKRKVFIFSGDKMATPHPANTFCMALTPKQVAEDRLRFAPCFTFLNWRTANIPDYSTAVKQIADKGALPPTQERIFWLGNPDEWAIRHALLQEGKKHSFCNFINSGENHTFKDKKDAAPVAFISMADQTENKYLLDIEGLGYSGRLKYLLFSRRPVFVVARPWMEFWHYNLKPWEHFIPVKRDLSDLKQNWEKVEASPDLYQHIAENAFAFASAHLTYEAMLDFFKNYLRKKL